MFHVVLLHCRLIYNQHYAPYEHIYMFVWCVVLVCPSRLRCPRLWLRAIAGKSTCGGSVAFPGKPTRRAVTTMGSNDLVVGEVHMLGPSCQRYNWHTGRCGSIAFGSSPRRGKTLISNPRCLAEVSTSGKDFRR